MNIDPSQILIPALILSHLLVVVAGGFIGYHTASRDSLAIISGLQKRIDELENPNPNPWSDDYNERCDRLRDLRITCRNMTHEKAWLIASDPEATRMELKKCANATKRRTKSAKS